MADDVPPVAEGVVRELRLAPLAGLAGGEADHGAEKVVPGYNVMGVCKAALDASMRYAAHDLGPRGIRVNALSAGPLKTLASSAVGAKGMEALYEYMSPIGRNITHEEVGRTGAFLLSDMSDGITGEIMHIDGGYNMMGSPGRLLDKIEAGK